MCETDSKTVVGTLLEFFARKNFPIDQAKLEALFQSNEALVRSALEIASGDGLYRGELKELHKAIRTRL